MYPERHPPFINWSSHPLDRHESATRVSAPTERIGIYQIHDGIQTVFVAGHADHGALPGTFETIPAARAAVEAAVASIGKQP